MYRRRDGTGHHHRAHLILRALPSVQRLFFTTLCTLLLAACQEQGPGIEVRSAELMLTWFAAAQRGERDDNLCHGLGVLKHQEFTCADMLDYASRIDPESRHVGQPRARSEFGSVTGRFFELDIDSTATSGIEVRETVVLKEDDGVLRVYWYRSDLMLETLKANRQEDEKEPEQIAYDEITARYPGLYAYPPCYGVRASSSTLVGELMPKDDIDVARVESLAEACGDTFCFGLVGQKIAPLCPQR